MVALVETDGQLDVLRVDQLEGWYGLGGDGVVRVLTAPTRQHRHQRHPCAAFAPAIRGKRTVCTLHGQAT